MPRIYSRSGSFKSDITYHFRCENCGREWSVNNTLEKEVKVSEVNRPPSVEQLMATAQKEFKHLQDATLTNADKGIFAVGKSAKCQNCGFLPTYMINRKQTIRTIIALLIISIGPAIPFFIPGGIADTAMAITIGLLCFVPIFALLGLLLRRMNPNRKLMRILSSEGRHLNPPEKPRIEFGPVLSMQ